MLVRESNGEMDCSAIHIVDSYQLSGRQVFRDRTERDQHLVSVASWRKTLSRIADVSSRSCNGVKTIGKPAVLDAATSLSSSG
jgi:hypothetical protein